MGADFAAVVKVDIDPRSVPIGKPEDDTELTVDVAVEPGRVEPPDEVGAF